MTDLARLVVALEAQTAKYQAGLDQAQKRLDRFDRDQTTLLSGIQKRWSNFGTTIAGVLAGISVGAAFHAIVKATSEAEAAQAQLNNALQNTGANVALASAEFQNFATALQRTTTFNDEAIIQVESLLLSFQGLSGQTVKDATAAVLDLSTRMGIDASSAAKILGKALTDPEKGMTALTRAGVIFSDQQKAQIKALNDSGQAAKAQGIILGELEQRFGGAAAAARNTFGGALAGLKNSFDDLLEGKSGFPAATESINSLTELLNSDRIKQGFDTIVSGFAKIIEVAAKAAVGISEFITGAKQSLDFLLGYQPDIPAIEVLTENLRGAKATLEELKVSRITTLLNPSALEDQQKLIDKLEQTINLRRQMDAAKPKGDTPDIANPFDLNSPLNFVTGGTPEEDPVELTKKQMAEKLKIAQQEGEGIYAVEQLVTELHDQELQKRYELDDQYYRSVNDLTAANVDMFSEVGKKQLDDLADITQRQIELERDKNEQIAAFEESRIQASANLLGILFGKHKVVAAAIFLLQKRHAIAQAVIDTKKAVMATYAKLGYPWGIPAAIAVGAIGAASIAEMVATNPGTAGIITGGGGNGFVPPGSQDNPIHTTEQESGRRGVDDKPVTQVIFQGDVYGLDDFQEKVFDALDTGINVRDRVPIRLNSRQAIELKG